jgi:hypothetical protein
VFNLTLEIGARMFGMQAPGIGATLQAFGKVESCSAIQIPG